MLAARALALIRSTAGIRLPAALAIRNIGKAARCRERACFASGIMGSGDFTLNYGALGRQLFSSEATNDRSPMSLTQLPLGHVDPRVFKPDDSGGTTRFAGPWSDGKLLFGIHGCTMRDAGSHRGARNNFADAGRCDGAARWVRDVRLARGTSSLACAGGISPRAACPSTSTSSFELGVDLKLLLSTSFRS